MKHKPALKIIIPLIALLALLAAGTGLFYQTAGDSYPFTSHRGETVMINGHGLYYYDTVSSAAQQQGNDIVTLVIGVPFLAVATWLAFRGSLRGRLLLTGILGFFLYTYLSMSMLTSFNAFFLVYVALFALSLYAFILCMMSFDLATLPRHFSERLPRRWIAGLLFVIGGFLSLAWLAKVVTPFLQNVTPPLENTTTFVIQAMDLALIVPLAVLAGILLLRRSAWGYLLSSVFVMKAIALGLAVSAMSVNMTLAGTPDSLAIMVPFLIISMLNLVAAASLLKHVMQ
ncbi:MAG: hypothetical protein KA362_00785 [Chloroflexi bacterium]|nr:hypothetical protein [Chloroflexota bacterium]MBK6711117.1 hypothetical protein [Chloroflexota bacterium]MBK7176117.1 hypothetical protein [Chloroflexota bacterium]MBK7916005.1 hypothetical protein [Chloroflexota bacterium]MBK8931009.1 hypothetical protein [Chloroflexota bacterium]